MICFRGLVAGTSPLVCQCRPKSPRYLACSRLSRFVRASERGEPENALFFSLVLRSGSQLRLNRTPATGYDVVLSKTEYSKAVDSRFMVTVGRSTFHILDYELSVFVLKILRAIKFSNLKLKSH